MTQIEFLEDFLEAIISYTDDIQGYIQKQMQIKRLRVILKIY